MNQPVFLFDRSIANCKRRVCLVVIVLIVAAIVTPPDVVSQVTVAIPMLLIYEASIWISVFVEKNKKRDEQTS